MIGLSGGLRRWLVAAACAGILSGVSGFGSSSLRAAGLETEWVRGHASQARLIGGRSADTGPGQFVAGVELVLSPGWKTYWRNPGDAGVPPEFDWSGSQNTRAISVLYPAPHRYNDQSGQTIGYKGAVIFPVRVVAADPEKPVALRLKFGYGICERMCIPAEAELTLKFPARQAFATSAALMSAFQSVPRVSDEQLETDPRLVSHRVEFEGAAPHLAFTVRDPAAGTSIDLFVEAADGAYVPMTQKLTESGSGTSVFKVDLTKGADVSDLRGNTLIVTVVGENGQSENRIKLE